MLDKKFEKTEITNWSYDIVPVPGFDLEVVRYRNDTMGNKDAKAHAVIVPKGSFREEHLGTQEMGFRRRLRLPGHDRVQKVYIGMTTLDAIEDMRHGSGLDHARLVDRDEFVMHEVPDFTGLVPVLLGADHFEAYDIHGTRLPIGIRFDYDRDTLREHPGLEEAVRTDERLRVVPNRNSWDPSLRFVLELTSEETVEMAELDRRVMDVRAEMLRRITGIGRDPDLDDAPFVVPQTLAAPTP